MDRNYFVLAFLIVCSIGVAVADLDSLRWGCPLPNLNTDDCIGVAIERVCNITADCFDLGKNANTICCVTDCGGTDCIESTKKRGVCKDEYQPTGVFGCGGLPPAEFNCGVDGECPGREKCCFKGCEGTFCKEPKGPAKKKLGCPFPDPTTECPSPQLPDECLFDDDCTGGKTCCRHSCGHAHCLKSKNRKGDCPKPGIKTGFCTDEDRELKCGIDPDCPGKKKCCAGICGSSKCIAKCKDSKKWRGTMESDGVSCVNCSCKKMNKKRFGVLMQLACLDPTTKAQIFCCKSCKAFAGFNDPFFDFPGF